MRSQSFGFLGFAAGLVLAGCSAAPAPQLAAAPAPAAPTAPQPALTPEELAAVKQDNLTVNFELGTDRLTPDALKQLDLAVRLFRDVHPVMMYSVGYADGTGEEFNNVLLSARRARAVKEALVARGIPANQLLIQALGQSMMAIPGTPKAAENRRVLVKWRMT